MRRVLASLVSAIALAVVATLPAAARKAATIDSLNKTAPAAVPAAAPVAADRAQAIAAYKRFLQLEANDSRLRAEALRRLADLTLEADEESLSADSPNLAAGTGAAALYEQLLADHPDGNDQDRVLYQLARAHEINGDTDKALASLHALVAGVPESNYRAEAWFRIGELEFVKGRYPAAGTAFGKVLQMGPQSPFYAQALYKHGWSLFKQSRHMDCLPSFVTLVERVLPANGELAAATLKRAERELLDDALRALSISFSYLDGPAAIASYLDGRAELAFEDLLFERLGDLYLEQKRYSDAADAFNAFAARRPVHRRAPLLSSRVIEAYAAGGFAARVLDAKSAFAERYALHGEFWRDRDSSAFPEVLAALKSHLADLANHWHAVAQRSSSGRDYRSAARWYRTLLESFPGDADAPSNSFLLAELLHESGDMSAASRQFELTAYEFGAHPKAAAAGYAALVSYAALQEASGIKNTEAQAQWRDLHIDSALRFASVFRTDPRANAVQLFAAEALFADGALAAAIAAAEPVTRSSMDSDLLRTAWTVTGHAQFDQQHFGEAELAYLELRALGARNIEDRVALDDRLGAAIYKQGEVARDAGNSDAAVAHFLRVGDTVPGTDVHPIAVYDAAAVLTGNGNWAQALPLLETFRREHPGHSLTGSVDALLALTLENSGQPGRAADGYLRIAEALGSGQERRTTLWHAASLYQAAQDNSAAAAVLATIATEAAIQLAERMDAQEQLVNLARDRGDTAAERRWLKAQIEADREAANQRSDRSRALAAHASLALALPAVQHYQQVALTLPLKASLREKKRRLEAALRGLDDAAGYRVIDVSTHAGFLVAELYYDFSKALMDSERPAGLDEMALEEYELLLEEQAFPFEEKAIEVHQINAARAADGIYDQWVQDSFARLAELLPVRFAKTEVSDGIIESLD